MDFIYQDPYPVQKDDTVYKQISSDYVKVEKLGEREILTVDPKGIELLA
jgi:fumarate hydratase class I